MILFYLICALAALFFLTALAFALLWHNALRRLEEKEKRAYANGIADGALGPRRAWE